MASSIPLLGFYVKYIIAKLPMCQCAERRAAFAAAIRAAREGDGSKIAAQAAFVASSSISDAAAAARSAVSAARSRLARR